MVYHRFTIGLTPICWQVPSGLARLPDAVGPVNGLVVHVGVPILALSGRTKGQGGLTDQEVQDHGGHGGG